MNSSYTHSSGYGRFDGGVIVDGNTVIDDGAGWHRSYGDTGWYNGTHGGGWRMTDSTYIRTYGSKHVYIGGQNLHTDGGTIYANNNGVVRARNSSNTAYASLGITSGDGQLTLGSANGGTCGANIKHTGGSGGNLHLDSWNCGAGNVYLNHYTGGNTTYIRNGAGNGGRGNINAADVNYTSLTNGSSQTIKQNIQTLGYGLEEVAQLNPVSYQYTSEYDIDETGRLHYGLISEEVAQHLPNLLTPIELNSGRVVDGLNYIEIMPILINATKELKVITDDLDSRLAVIESGSFNVDLTLSESIIVAKDLTVGGETTLETVTINGKLISAGDTPTAVLGATTTGQGSTYTIEGNDIAGSITITTGTDTPTNPIDSGEQITVTFNTPYDDVPRIALTAKGAESAGVRYFVETTETEFIVTFLDAPGEATDYTFDYIIIQ